MFLSINGLNTLSVGRKCQLSMDYRVEQELCGWGWQEVNLTGTGTDLAMQMY